MLALFYEKVDFQKNHIRSIHFGRWLLIVNIIERLYPDLNINVFSSFNNDWQELIEKGKKYGILPDDKRYSIHVSLLPHDLVEDTRIGKMLLRLKSEILHLDEKFRKRLAHKKQLVTALLSQPTE